MSKPVFYVVWLEEHREQEEFMASSGASDYNILTDEKLMLFNSKYSSEEH